MRSRSNIVFTVVATLAIFSSGCKPDKPPAADALRETTPLHSAASAGELFTVQKLIDGGADPNGLDESGRTPLHLAAANGHNGTVETLLTGGALPTLRDDDGRLAYELAMAGGHKETAEALRNPPPPKKKADAAPAAADVPRETTPLHSAASAGDPFTVQKLIDAGADPNAQDESGKTPLHLAAANGHSGTVEALLKGGALATVRDDNGRLAHEFASTGGHPETAAALRNASAPGRQAGATKQTAAPVNGINPALAYRDAASFGKAIGTSAILVSGEHVHIFAAKEHAEAARIVLPYLDRAFEELSTIVGTRPEYDLVVYHFTKGHPEAFGGTSNGTIWYDDANLRLSDHEEWREFKVPHVSGYIEEMAHNFVSSAHVQFGWEMVGWSVGIAVTSKVAPTPIFQRALDATRQGQAETYRRYVADGYVFPADIAANQVDRIHAYLLWQAEQQYGPNLWKDFFAEVQKSQPEFQQTSEIEDTNSRRNARYQLSWKCFDRLPGVSFRHMLAENQISLTTDIKSLDPEGANWNRRLQ